MLAGELGVAFGGSHVGKAQQSADGVEVELARQSVGCELVLLLPRWDSEEGILLGAGADSHREL